MVVWDNHIRTKEVENGFLRHLIELISIICVFGIILFFDRFLTNILAI